MEQWWRGRTSRERILLVVCAVLIGAVVYWQALFTPLVDAARDARARFEEQSKISRSLQALALEPSANPARAAPRATPAATRSLRADLTETARLASLNVGRLQPEPSGAVTAWVDPAPSRAVFAWLLALGQRGYEVSAFTAERVDAGRVRVQVTIREPKR